jgi:hypothetical protein
MDELASCFNKFEKIDIFILKMNKNKLSYIPAFESNKNIKSLLFEAEDNLI